MHAARPKHEGNRPGFVSGFESRFLASTRGKIVVLLRRARHTVDELAAAVGLTDNAVRAHLATLERDGLVQQQGVRRGEGKPASLYELTAEAERLFPKAHAPVLSQLLTVLEERTSSDDMTAALREVGQRLADGAPTPHGSPRVESSDSGSKALHLVGYSCPLGAIVDEHPEACLVAEALVARASGLRVSEHCERDDGHPPRCRFEVEPIDA
ncbi:MAG: ArsR family transcriptional regulator [Chloroflexi bacterium]|nr:MAG: ArsR family transcriptional regulator [Chloroflexota bacterium]